MNLVAVTNKLTRRGVRAPGTRGETWDWRAGAGSPENTGRVRPTYRAMSMSDAMSTEFDFDAQMTPCILVPPDGNPLSMQPGICKDALPWLRAQGFGVVASCMIVEVHNPNRRPWTDEDRERARFEHAGIPMLATVGVYSTRQSRCLIQPLDRALDVDTFERTVRAFALALEQAGVVGVDHRCSDWTRHYRVPHGLRKGFREPPWWLDTSGMAPIPPPAPVATVPRQQKAPKGTSRHAPAVEPTWSVELPPGYRPLVADLGDALFAFTGARRAAFLAVAGALCERGVPAEHIPVIVAGVSVESHRDDATHERVADAYRTVRRWQENWGIPGLRALRSMSPDIAKVLERHTMSASEQRLYAQVAAARAAMPPAMPIENAIVGIERTIAGAQGVVAVEVGCGIGASEAILRVALARSRNEAKSEDAASGRAPQGSKTAIACRTHELAVQHTGNLRRRGVGVMRVFGPLSVLREDGSPECRYHEAGTALAAGGQSIPWEFCRGRDERRCDHWETCKARDGVDADDGARIVIGAYPEMATLMKEVGSNGLLVIDEPPEPIEVSTFSEADFLGYAPHAGDFLPRYWIITLPLILAARAALASGAITRTDEPQSAVAVLGIGWRDVPEEVVRAALEAAGDTEPLEDTDTMARVFAAQHLTLPEDAAVDSPALQPGSALAARDAPGVAANLGRASSLVRVLVRAASQEPPASLRISDFNGRRTLTVALIAREFMTALRRGGPTVLVDADLSLHHPIAELVL